METAIREACRRDPDRLGYRKNLADLLRMTDRDREAQAIYATVRYEAHARRAR
ncbi:hypothetical protein [Actinosynnema sp. ALI-1.44]|uniref:hypothetical protein n=1 Tax=Actinosynnema sp. ALI-1.44 TaxID=1933779 RepID=UPI00143DFC96|nr:hypothetical protein [Actinosynnema sp. ALI-1.44]